MTTSLCDRGVYPDIPPATCRTCGGCIRCCECDPATVTSLAPRQVLAILAGADDSPHQPDGGAA